MLETRQAFDVCVASLESVMTSLECYFLIRTINAYMNKKDSIVASGYSDLVISISAK